jgi:hypothetical protein
MEEVIAVEDSSLEDKKSECDSVPDKACFIMWDFTAC